MSPLTISIGKYIYFFFIKNENLFSQKLKEQPDTLVIDLGYARNIAGFELLLDSALHDKELLPVQFIIGESRAQIAGAAAAADAFPVQTKVNSRLEPTRESTWNASLEAFTVKIPLEKTERGRFVRVIPKDIQILGIKMDFLKGM